MVNMSSGIRSFIRAKWARRKVLGNPMEVVVGAGEIVVKLP
jgi:hypothetical protein